MEMDELNSVNTYYYKAVNDKAIARGAHRNFVGGLWDEVGALQLGFLQQEGLLPQHKLLDVGCGCLRGGVKFIDYLDSGNYYGLDVNSSLLKAAKVELVQAGLEAKLPTLLLDGQFEASYFNVKFEFALAISVFTHLPLSIISKCLAQVKLVLSENGAFYATYFPAPCSEHLAVIQHQPGKVMTHYDRDPYHCSLNEISQLADQAGLAVDNIGEWGHPRAQQMLKFSLY